MQCHLENCSGSEKWCTDPPGEGRTFSISSSGVADSRMSCLICRRGCSVKIPCTRAWRCSCRGDRNALRLERCSSSSLSLSVNTFQRFCSSTPVVLPPCTWSTIPGQTQHSKSRSVRWLSLHRVSVHRDQALQPWAVRPSAMDRAVAVSIRQHRAASAALVQACEAVFLTADCVLRCRLACVAGSGMLAEAGRTKCVPHSNSTACTTDAFNMGSAVYASLRSVAVSGNSPSRCSLRRRWSFCPREERALCLPLFLSRTLPALQEQGSYRCRARSVLHTGQKQTRSVRLHGTWGAHGVVIQAGRVPSRAWPCMARHLAAGQEKFRQRSY